MQPLLTYQQRVFFFPGYRMIPEMVRDFDIFSIYILRSIVYMCYTPQLQQVFQAI